LQGKLSPAKARQTFRHFNLGTKMQTLIKRTIQYSGLIYISTLLLAYNPVMAATDLEAQEGFLKARVSALEQNTDHSAHTKPVDDSQKFRGVFYGYIPCNDCKGIKTTLSLKQNNNYLLVTQPARDSSREFYEKGKYYWNDENQTLVLTPNKEGEARRYHIEDEGTLIQLDSEGLRMMGDSADRWFLRRSDKVKSREVHIH
jgi:uncharacterized lipoprotein NlpE involved in copper resistance